MNILSTINFNWRRGKKTKGLKAKALINLIVDRSIVNKFLIDTLEGREPIDSANIFCIGEAGDAWQQTSKALLKKYDVKAIDDDGWMVCEPKPENEVEFVELNNALLDTAIKTDFTNWGQQGHGYIVGTWGATIDGVENLQAFVLGDFMCRQPHDHTDMWIVRRTLFLNTYTELGGK
jgi:hypothetical protein